MASTARIDELRKKFDENPRRYFAPLANEFRKAGEIEQAIMICEEFLPQQPGHMSGHIVYGQALFEVARFEEARTVFETALTLDPENLIALRHLGDIAKGQGDVPAARRWYDRVLDADPRNDEILALITGLESAAPPAPATTEPTSELATEPAAPAPAESGLTIERAPDPAFAPESHARVDEQAGEHRFAPPPLVPPPLPEPIELEKSADDSRSSPRTSPPPAVTTPYVPEERAAGLESMEFSPPAGPLDREHDLGSSVEAGEFTAPSARIEPLAGLEETSIGAFERVPDGGPPLPMLDTSESAPRAGSDSSREQAGDAGAPTLEFSVPTAAEGAASPRQSEPSPQSVPAPEMVAKSEATAEVPPELPPAVIAAEARLMDLGDPLPEETPARPSPVSAAPVERGTAASAAGAPFVTETMAELFLKQGFTSQALDVYRQLLETNPHEERYRARVAELQPAGPAAAGDSVRDFLARLATLRPGERGAAQMPPAADDFSAVTEAPARMATPPRERPMADHATAPAAAAAPARHTPSSVMSTGIERGATTQGAGGSIDALFGNRAVGTSEDSAASALAQAFGGAAENAPVITGRPARAAAGELSLDSVFRDGASRPPRASQSFSFDQFFSPDSATADRGAAPTAAPATAAPDASAPTEPAERSADDIEQFNTWLQGLKPK